MDFSTDTLGIIAVAALALAVVLAAVVALLWVRLTKVRSAHADVFDAKRGGNVSEVFKRLFDDNDQLRRDLGIVHKNTEHLRELLRGSVSRVGLVRYDAFADMGGQLSFSAALLDERGDGVVFTAINGRTEARSYAKPVAGGGSSYNLSPEELAAIEAALSGEKGKVAPVPRRLLRKGRAAS